MDADGGDTAKVKIGGIRMSWQVTIWLRELFLREILLAVKYSRDYTREATLYHEFKNLVVGAVADNAEYRGKIGDTNCKGVYGSYIVLLGEFNRLISSGCGEGKRAEYIKAEADKLWPRLTDKERVQADKVVQKFRRARAATRRRSNLSA